jgi:integrase
MSAQARHLVEKHKPRSEPYGHGVSVSLQRNAAGYYVIRWTENGRRRSTKRKSFADAHELGRELSAALSGPGGHLRAVSGHSSALTIVDQYFASSTFNRLAPSTRAERKSLVRRCFSTIAIRYPSSQWGRAVDEMIELEICKGLAPTTIRKDFATLKAIGSWAQREELLDAHAVSYRIRPPKVVAKNMDDLPAEAEIQLVMDALQADYNPMIVKLAAFSGPRIGEILALTAADFDVEDGAFWITKQIGSDDKLRNETKNGSARRVWWPPLLDEEVKILVDETIARQGEKGRVFPYNRNQFEHAFTRARLKAGWTDSTGTLKWSFHDLRHFFCTWALSATGWGLDVADVSKLAGHHSPEFTYRVYVKSRPGIGARVRAAGKGPQV